MEFNSMESNEWFDNIFSMTDDELKIKLVERNISYEDNSSRKELVSLLCNYMNQISNTEENNKDSYLDEDALFQTNNDLVKEQNIEYLKSLENEFKKNLSWKHLKIDPEPMLNESNILQIKIKLPSGKSKVRLFKDTDQLVTINNIIRIILETDDSLHLYSGNDKNPLDQSKSFKELGISGRIVISSRFREN